MDVQILTMPINAFYQHRYENCSHSYLYILVTSRVVWRSPALCFTIFCSPGNALFHKVFF